LNRLAPPFSLGGIADSLAVSWCVERHRYVTEMSHESARQAEYVRDAFVLGAAVPDQNRGAGCMDALGAPADARNEVTIHAKIETLFYDAFLSLLTEDFHDPYLTV
jgi:hypothetical protein